jgi:hypothetical protein
MRITLIILILFAQQHWHTPCFWASVFLFFVIFFSGRRGARTFSVWATCLLWPVALVKDTSLKRRRRNPTASSLCWRRQTRQKADMREQPYEKKEAPL